MRGLFVALAFAAMFAFPCGAESPSGENSNNASTQSTLQADDLSWWSIDAGGGQSSAGSLGLTGVIGQPESGTASFGGLIFDGGLWSTTLDFGAIFADDFESGNTDAWSTQVGAVLVTPRQPSNLEGGA